MNKKIKNVVKNYEEKMKFQSKFESLSQKLDLIPDNTPIKSDVIVIKRRMIPAYLMSVIVMALISGVIGLQIGLSNLKLNTEYINPIEIEVQKHVDEFLTHSISFIGIDHETAVSIFFGTRNNEEYLIVYSETAYVKGEIEINYESQVFKQSIQKDGKWMAFVIDKEKDIIEFNYTLTNSLDENISKDITLDMSEIRVYFYN